VAVCVSHEVPLLLNVSGGAQCQFMYALSEIDWHPPMQPPLQYGAPCWLMLYHPDTVPYALPVAYVIQNPLLHHDIQPLRWAYPVQSLGPLYAPVAVKHVG